jgi:pimeloyl-ACP methyl ester carboxylesterase
MPQPQVSPSNIAGFPALRTAGTADRPLLLFIHGAFASHEPFANWMQTLGRDGWRCVAAGRRNQLGHGPAGVADVTIDDYVADTLRVIDALNEKPVVIGHSLGGLIAQKIAELGKCSAAVLVAPGAVRNADRAAGRASGAAADGAEYPEGTAAVAELCHL